MSREQIWSKLRELLAKYLTSGSDESLLKIERAVTPFYLLVNKAARYKIRLLDVSYIDINVEIAQQRVERAKNRPKK